MIYEILPNEYIFRFEILLDAGLEKVWKFVSDTDRANQFLGEPAIEYEDSPDERGGSQKEGILKSTGFTLKFKELSPEWVNEKYFQIVREHTSGPLKRFIHRIDLVEKDEKIILKNTIRVILRWKLVAPINVAKFHLDVIPRYKKYYQSVESLPTNDYNLGITEIKKTIKPEELTNLLHKFSLISHNDLLCNLVASFLLKSQDLDLLKIRPYRLAVIWKEKKKEVLEFFLRGTKEGFFDMNWDVLCPSCRGAKSSSNSLLDMKMKVHCPSCNIDYAADFDKSVELTFTPNPTIRPVFGGIYCASGPGSTPHIKFQIRVQSDETQEVGYKLLAGIYKLYSLQSKVIIDITVDASGEEIEEIQFDGITTRKIHILPGTKRFLLSNSDRSGEIVVKLEHAVWLENIVTASEVTAMHEFRELFSSEVLRPGEEIGVKNLSILFTDLKGSTEFYNTRGDAFAYRAVSNHFQILIQNITKYDGAIVKTIGDAIMAIFYLPVNAVLYSIQIQKELKELNKKEYGENVIVLKVGIHTGPVLAVNQNEKLDYFGKTVNLAARVEGKCKGGDIVITKVLYENEQVKELIKKENIQIEIFESNLKGFEESSELVRLIL
ncbi:MAG: adenylate/guanylate cyclase domain-containing protein [Leptospiraceae bacterium]|nr:adenylate/guanylate cyclase domain-containing protein [Leptospiraceae bacterium]